MNDLGTTSVTREIPASAADIFDLLSNPHKHHLTDGGGTVRSLDQGDRLKAVGDTFTMNMEAEGMGEYQTRNKVYAFADGRVIGWQNEENITTGVKVGSKWLWELEPVDAATTVVTLTYDPREIEDPKVQALSKNFDLDELDASLAALAEAVA